MVVGCGRTCWDVSKQALTFFWASRRVSSENSLWMTSGGKSSQEIGKMLAQLAVNRRAAGEATQEKQLQLCQRCFVLQMQVSPSAALRGTRRWNRPGDLRSPCSSRNATRTEHLPRSKTFFPAIFFFFARSSPAVRTNSA